jgi:hypothetical protein
LNNNAVKYFQYNDLENSKQFTKKIFQYLNKPYIKIYSDDIEYQLFVISFLKLNYAINIFLETFQPALLLETIEFMLMLKKNDSKISKLFSDFVSKIFSVKIEQ